MTRQHPYRDLPPEAFWRSAVSDQNALEIAGLYRPRFAISRETVIAAAGSCFAQHIAREFKNRQFSFLDVEPPPPQLPRDQWHVFGYDLYSARYGNIYSPRQLLQLFQRAYGLFEPSQSVWQTDGRHYDPFRPSIEPSGFVSFEEARVVGEFHLAGLREICERAELFVFTFGLTEAWINAEDGAVYPSCPGVIASTFDERRHRFHNFTYGEILADTDAFIAFVKARNPTVRFLFTVSPVPLTATASGQHVLTASIYSKSVLRAVCGELYGKYEEVDYFPSYEIVAAHPARAMFFESNLRTVSRRGVDHVMSAFFSAHGLSDNVSRSPQSQPDADFDNDADDVICDDEILEVFGR